MDSSREESPDWLRSFQAPTLTALSSGSSSSLSDRPLCDDDDDDDDDDGMSLGKLLSKDKSPNKKAGGKRTPGGKRKRESQPENESEDADDLKVSSKRKATKKPISLEEPKHSVWRLSSDSESCPDTSPVRKDYLKSERTKDPLFLDSDGESSPTKDVKMKSPKKQLEKENRTPKKMKVERKTNDGNMDAKEEDIPDKRNGQHVSYARLPLLLPEKVQRSKALVECDGDSIDLSGDVGAVGRVVISDNPSRSNEMLLDLKGTIYKTTIVPSRTFCVVSFGQSEAKIEAIMNDFIQLTPHSNVYEAETMVEGTLDGYSFDSEEEGGNLPKKAGEGNQNESSDDEKIGKTERKAKKSLGAEQKNGKSGRGKQPKKGKKKPQVTKKNKKK